MDQRYLSKDEDIGFWKNIAFVAIFFLLTPVTLGVSLFSLFSLRTDDIARQNLVASNIITSPESGISVYASLPGNIPSVSDSIESADARPQVIKKYLEKYSSPLTPQAGFIVETADKYKVDFRLITAIAQQESNLCKIIPPDSYNCWGWGIHSKGTLGFSSYEEGIEEVSLGLRNEYLNKGYTTVEDIMSKYTPQSNGSWANGVNQFLTEME
jgi:hypothetical protein